MSDPLVELERRYQRLQRRTLLYGLLSLVVGMLESLLIIRVFSVTQWPIALVIGLLVGVVTSQLAVYIVRKLNPL